MRIYRRLKEIMRTGKPEPCIMCGGEILENAEGDQYCGHCGARVPEEETYISKHRRVGIRGEQEEREESLRRKTAEEENARKKNNRTIFTLALIALISVGFLVYQNLDSIVGGFYDSLTPVVQYMEEEVEFHSGSEVAVDPFDGEFFWNRWFAGRSFCLTLLLLSICGIGILIEYLMKDIVFSELAVGVSNVIVHLALLGCSALTGVAAVKAGDSGGWLTVCIPVVYAAFGIAVIIGAIVALCSPFSASYTEKAFLAIMVLPLGCFNWGSFGNYRMAKFWNALFNGRALLLISIMLIISLVLVVWAKKKDSIIVAGGILLLCALFSEWGAEARIVPDSAGWLQKNYPAFSFLYYLAIVVMCCMLLHSVYYRLGKEKKLSVTMAVATVVNCVFVWASYGNYTLFSAMLEK